MKGRRVCFHHGGATPRGIANPNTTHGRYSAHLPPPLATEYLTRRSNPELFKLADDIALIETRIGELISHLSTGERGTVFEDLQLTLMDLDAAKQAGESIDHFLDELRTIAATGKETAQAWRAIDAAVHSKAKLISIEGRRQADMSETASRDEVKYYIGQTIRIFREAITDLAPADAEAIFRRVMAELPRIVAGPAAKPLPVQHAAPGEVETPAPAPPIHAVAANPSVQVESNPNTT
jgi:hypothetical protein